MEAEGAVRVEVFQYPAGPEPPFPPWDGFPAGGTHGPPGSGASGEGHEEGLPVQFERKMAEESRRSFEAGRERGLQEGHQAERMAQAAAAMEEKQRVEQVAKMIERFAQERDRFLHAVEHEVVELALAVAARILRREAQMDPLLLTGAVRVALGQLSNSTKVRLRVPASELDLWTESIAIMPNLALKPEVLVGEGMRLGDCVIETELGSVDLGIRAQLGEIERGFFDRAARSGSVSAGRGGEPAEAALEARA